MAILDVTVMGAGIFGLSVAWACQKRGATVRVVDPFRPGAGASGGTVGALAPHTPENWNSKKQFQFESLMMAEHFWPEIDAVSGLSSGYGRAGRLQPLADDAAVALARTREVSARDLWQGRAEWRVVAGGGDRWAPDTPTGYLVHDTLTARLHPRAAIESLAAALKVKGVEFRHDSAPHEGRVVWATGYQGLIDLSRELSVLVGTGVKGQSALLALDARDVPQIFADGIHIVPHADGTVGVGSTTERAFDRADTTDAQLDAVIARAEAVMPVLRHAKVIERWAGVRPRAKSRAPILGEWPGRPGHYIANGGFKIGFGMAPKVADVMADLVLEGLNRVPDGFRVGDNL
ncbi:FAD-binding oxidoreductase [Defluviimonas aestuarii]|uniref:NAD(P)/FAD-dependent oxidoreductase n=1 Tax=Albidovulum aestuarii TaxID=1130726 RepID=UPI00249CA3C5|nr:FAD-binding oxidoreductase [Defluviimonas aestuarii]MDI3338338.1 FAD-binding oxidoreductase [Defluviimonas aestuarii]